MRFVISILFRKKLSEILSEYQTVWIQIRPDILLPVHVMFISMFDKPATCTKFAAICSPQKQWIYH